MSLRPHFIALGLVSLAWLACVPLNAHGSRSDGGTDSAVDGPASVPDIAQDRAALDVTQDYVAPADTALPPPDVVPTECAPDAIGCAADNRSTRVCNDQGRWIAGVPCATDALCSGGVCVCSSSEFCDEGSIVQTPASGWVPDLAAGGRFVFLATNGPRASIRRFDVETQPPTETIVRMGQGDLTVFALDSDPTDGTLIWCSDVVAGATRIGEVMYGEQQLDTGAPCTRVQRRDDLVYYKTDALYRRAHDASMPAVTLAREAMSDFAIAGDYAYFVGEADPGSFLKRTSVVNPAAPDPITILHRPDTTFFRVMADAGHAYVITDGQILRVPAIADAQPEVFWQEAGVEAWATAQTDTHVYWTATTAPAAAGCGAAQVFRRPKSGGAVTVLSRTTGYCAGPLVLVGDHLFTAIWAGVSSMAPTKVLRARL